MHTRALRTVGIALGCCVAVFLAALVVGRLPLEEHVKVTLIQGILSPFLVVGRSLTFLIDAFGPKGLPEPASHYAPTWAIRLLVVLMFGFGLLGFCALVVLWERVGWRIATAIPLALAGLFTATDGFDTPVLPESGASPETWFGSVVGLGAVYLFLAGLSRNSRARRPLRLATAVLLGGVVAAASWLAYLLFG